jgi:NADH:ubiquinone oxidoreductase subunit 5 (subunit L)/multisubunit Na+/H+ antiporter MnhA subunit
MFHLGGLYRKMPISTILWCIASLGIMGIPPLNGFASKTLLHEAIIEARNIAAADGSPYFFWLALAEFLFVISAAGTVLSFVKTTYYTFFRKAAAIDNRHHEIITEAPVWMNLGTGILAFGVIFTGLFPNLMMERIIGPIALMLTGLDTASVEHLAEIPFFTWYNIQNILIPFSIGVTAFIIANYLHLFEENSRLPALSHFWVPVWFSFDYWYVSSARSLETVLTREIDFSFPESIKNWVISVPQLIGEKTTMLEKRIKNWVIYVSQRIGKKPRALEIMDRDIVTGTLVTAAMLALLLFLRLL